MSEQQVRAAAAAIANARGGRRGVPPIVNVLDILSAKLREEVMEDAKAALEATADFQPTHHHYKGGLYQLLHRATYEANLRDAIVYRDAAGKIWVRDSIDFFTTLPDGRPRFATIKPGETA